jgi:putative MFS transporter
VSVRDTAQPDGSRISVAAALDEARLIARLEAVPTSGWHIRAHFVMGSATFLDAFNASSIAFVLPILVRDWHISAPQIGVMIGASYVGQFMGALAFSWGAERWGV